MLWIDHLIHHPAEYGPSKAERGVDYSRDEAFTSWVILPSDVHGDDVGEAGADSEENGEEYHKDMIVGGEAGEEDAEDSEAATDEVLKLWIEIILSQMGTENTEWHEDCVEDGTDEPGCLV